LALGAALNLKRPILAVHGPPGTGKTRLLTEYLNLLRKQVGISFEIEREKRTYLCVLRVDWMLKHAREVTSW
jgi:Ni2+-binding GTPase involved in maturation of urease and hydrogenase